MRWIDHWVGLPVCFLLGIAVFFARRILPLRKRKVSGKKMLAVFKFFGMGSIIEATPLLRAIRQQYPDAPLAFVTFDSNKELLERMTPPMELRIIRTSPAWNFALDVLKTALWLRSRKVEAVVDLEFFSKFSTLLSLASGAHIRIGYHLNDFWRYSLVTHPIYFNYFRHLVDVFCEAGRQMGVTVEDRRLSRIDPGQAGEKSVRTWLAERGWTPEARLLGINVNAAELSYERRWTIERYGAVVEELLRRHADLRIVLAGSASEREYTRSLFDHVPASLHDRIFLAAGEWSLEEFLAGLLLFEAFLTNDSGPMHMAAAQGVGTVSIWGPTRPGFFAPQSDGHTFIWKNYPCSPCVGMFTTFEGMWCNHEGWCMQDIAPDAVIEAVESALRRASQRRGERDPSAAAGRMELQE